MWFRIVAASLLALGAMGAALAEDWGDVKDAGDYAHSKALCRALRTREPPASDRPDAAAARGLAGCDSEKLYYGIGMAPDPVRARRCAFVEAGTKDGDGPFSGRAMLMTIYANGRGAARDLDVATHLACGLDGAPFESDGRVNHLAALKGRSRAGPDFDYCDDISSGLAMGYCAAHQSEIDGVRREAALGRLTAGWTPAERSAFASLRKAEDTWVDAHGSNEVDLSGTARAAMEIAAEDSLRDSFLETLRTLSAGKAPHFSAAQSAAADAALNAAYAKARKAVAADGGPGAPTRDGIREAQRAWLRYRDAFLAFAAVKFPGVSRDSLAAWLARDRTAMLADPGD